MLAFLPRRSGVNQVWIASVLMFDATSDRSRSVRSRSHCAMSTSTSSRGVLGCAVMLDSDPCADDMSGSVSVRLFSAEVTSVVPSSTFVVFKFKSVSSTSVLTAGSPTFDPTGVALVLHMYIQYSREYMYSGWCWAFCWSVPSLATRFGLRSVR